MSLTGASSLEVLDCCLIYSRELQCPTWGYPSEGAYHRDASSSDSLLAVRVPLFAIHAEDDPVSQQAINTSIPPNSRVDRGERGYSLRGVQTDSVRSPVHHKSRRTLKLV